MIECNGSFEGPCKVYTYIRHITDDGPVFVISFTAFTVHIPLARKYEVFAEALNDPGSKAKSWCNAPGWCVKLQDDGEVQVYAGGIRLTMTKEQAKRLAWDILPKGKPPSF